MSFCFFFIIISVQIDSACEILSKCVEGICKNGGTCIEEYSSFSCKCPDDYFGRLCDEKYEKCSDNYNLCVRSTECVNIVSTYTVPTFNPECHVTTIV